MQDVIIKTGWHKNKEIVDLKCTLNGVIKYGARGWFGNFFVPGRGTMRIQLPTEQSIAYLNPIKLTATAAEEETEEQIIKRIKDRFDIFSMSVSGVATENIRALIVSGAPGIGKTETITQILEEHRRKNGTEFEIIRGNIVSSYQLYQLLYMNAESEAILILDDCDDILRDLNALNILKAALESGDRPRIISYKSQAVSNIGLPTEFEYKGKMIFITNENFQSVIDKDKGALAKHMKALIDRALYLDLMLHSRREIYCRIKEMISDNHLLDSQEIDSKYYDLILLWIKENLEGVRSLSLRTPIHLAEMIKSNPDNWQRMANTFLVRNR